MTAPFCCFMKTSKMAKLCVERNLKKLKSVMKKKALFSNSLSKSVFLTVLEILWNVSLGKKPCVRRFSKDTIKKVKTQKTLIRFLLNKDKSLKKRKKKFLNGTKKFKKAITAILDEFYEHCIEQA